MEMEDEHLAPGNSRSDKGGKHKPGAGAYPTGRVKFTCQMLPGAVRRLRIEASDGPGKRPQVGKLLETMILTYPNAWWEQLKKRKLGWKYRHGD
jgi:hypothetical protein